MKETLKESAEILAAAGLAILFGWFGTISLSVFAAACLMGALLLIAFIFSSNRASIAESRYQKAKDEKWVKILEDLSDL